MRKNHQQFAELQILDYQSIDSPVGKLNLYASQHALLAILWDNEQNKSWLKQATIEKNFSSQSTFILQQAIQQLQDYFLGKLQDFDLPLQCIGTTFQQQVWQQLQSIPYGQTISYLSVATSIGNAKAVRAVAHAIGQNPISIIIPCHRVIGTNGQLTGFAGGLENKQRLLDLEKHYKHK